ncbi:MAG: hypothetical protein FJ137_13380 [Deltaproteobacteria bacterium]|nr:hypothetical protein [Deltaproteobacteria bacterium]
MPTIGNRPGIPTTNIPGAIPGGVTPPATTATTATTPAATPAVTPPVVGNPNASGVGSVVQSVKLDGGYANITGTTQDYYAVAGQNVGNSLYNQGTNVAGATVATGQGYQRGAITVSSTPVDDKHFAIDVKTMHASSSWSAAKLAGNDDKLKLFLETKIQGKDAAGNPVEVIARLATVLNGPANNKGPFDGEHRFLVSYQDLEKALKEHNPNLSLFDAKGNFVAAGATVAIRAKWDAGHDWGGYGRMGVTEIPAPAKKNSAAAVQAGNVSGSSSAVKIAAKDMPVDFEHVMPATIQKKHPALFNQDKPMTVSTRLERELKGKVDSVVAHEAAIVRMQMIAAGYQPLVDEMRSGLATQLMSKAKMKPAEARAYAAKLHISPHTAWAQKDASGKFQDSPRFAEYKKNPQKLVDAGLAKDLAGAQQMIAFMTKNGVVFHDPLPLEDKYKGKKFEMQQSIIRRVRSNAIAEGVYNVKPGPGKLQSDIDASTKGEPCGLIRARIEASVELKDKGVDRVALEKYETEDGSPYNIIGQLLEDAGAYAPGNYSRFQLKPGADLTEVSFTMMQERHRFDIEVDGMKLDTSIDFVNVEDPPGSGNKATRQIVEMELEHKFISPPTVGGGAPQPTARGAAAPAAGAAGATTSSGPALMNNFSTLADQQKKTAELSDVSLNVPPRFHRLSDLEDKELWQTQEQLVSNAVTNALIGVIYPAGVGSCEQKGVELARALGKI